MRLVKLYPSHYAAVQLAKRPITRPELQPFLLWYTMGKHSIRSFKSVQMHVAIDIERQSITLYV